MLALGICGVTTMFSVVNGVMLRGFSFPTAERLASANFVDPSSANFFGVNGQISSMDFDELLPQQQSFEIMAAYLNGSTVNLTDNGKPQQLFAAPGREALAYLRQRGLSEEAIRRFRIGYAPNDGQLLIRKLTSEDYKIEELLAVGLIKKAEDRNEHFSFFRNREIVASSALWETSSSNP